MEWNSIEILYKPHYFGSSNNSINQLAYLEVHSNCPIPITGTGYKSIFLTIQEVEEYGGAVKLIEKLLNEAASLKEWLEFEKSQQQMNLF